MILTDYYKLVSNTDKERNTPRFDTVSSTGEYEPFEVFARRSREGRFSCYLSNVPDTFSRRARAKAAMSITNGKNISSIYGTSPDNPCKGYGDTKNTFDALLFLFNPDKSEMEIFVARGQKFNAVQLFQLFTDGQLDREMEDLRQSAERRGKR